VHVLWMPMTGSSSGAMRVLVKGTLVVSCAGAYVRVTTAAAYAPPAAPRRRTGLMTSPGVGVESVRRTAYTSLEGAHARRAVGLLEREVGVRDEGGRELGALQGGGGGGGAVTLGTLGTPYGAPRLQELEGLGCDVV